MRLIAILFIAACGAANTNINTIDPTPADEPDETRLSPVSTTAYVGPFDSWEALCGPARHTDGQHLRYEKCWVTIDEPVEGPFERLAMFHEGDPGSGMIALKTARGWFVREAPDGHPLFGGRSHHTPASTSVDAAASTVEAGWLKVVIRGSSSSFIPGRGAEGSSSQQWTSVVRCAVDEGNVVCAEPQQIWQRSCQEGAECSESGTDIPRG